MDNRFVKAFEVLLFGLDGPRTCHDTDLELKHQESINSTASSDNKSRLSPVVEEKHVSNEYVSTCDTPTDSEAGLPSSEEVGNPTSLSKLFKSPTLYSLTNVVQAKWNGKPESEAQWQPGFLQLRPLAGLSCLLISLAAVFTSLVILIVSDGQPVDKWIVQPTVYLALAAAISNTALVSAWSQASPVSWWYHASRGGSIRSLQRHWEVSQSLFRAVMHLSLLHLACLATSLVFIDGPFLQRASTVIRATTTKNVQLDLVLPPELSTGFSGYYQNVEFWASDISNKAAMGWMNDSPMVLPAKECKGTCRTVVHGPGLAERNCTSQTWPISSATLHSMNASWGGWGSTSTDIDGNLQRILPAFYVNLGTNRAGTDPSRELMYVTTGLVSWFSLTGQYEFKTCAYAPAVVEYDIEIDDSRVTFADGLQGRVVRLANNTHSLNPDENVETKQPSTLAALTMWMNVFVNANASVALNAAGGPEAFYSPDSATYNIEVLKHSNFSNRGDDLNYLDPTPDVINKFNEVMFRGALLTADWPNITQLIDRDESVKQTVQATDTVSENVFRTDLRWYAGAAAFELVTILLVLPMFFGWWTLGKNPTLSPFEVALAFDAPVLHNVNSASGARGVVRKLGEMKIKYGAADPGGIDHRFSNRIDLASSSSIRLGIAESSTVYRPEAGARFRT